MAKYTLADGADLTHKDAREWYEAFGWHLTTADAGDVCLQAVEYDWLDQSDDNGVILKLCDSMPRQLTVEEAASIVEMARSVREAAEAIESLLDEAVAAYESGDAKETIAALDRCASYESDYGDSPASSSLRSELLAEVKYDAQIDMAGDVIGVEWTGSAWESPTTGSQHPREWEALAVELSHYLSACGEPTDHIDGQFVRDNYDIIRGY
jgi:hypothetical protein